ncbi:ribonuclease III [Hippea sp. KM1]|uniref:ribonuclease III n=1 Tax=Hippea sp. KM1 TaxID=944481 RepID=UPI0004A7D032|nr:ribonuclease III [Hippea sp. KM1]
MEIEEKLGYTFKNKELLKRALTHRSYVKDKARSNERLEFLGDAVLELVVTEFLINNYKNIDEGKLSKIRAASVNTKTLSLLARRLGLSEHILVGKSEKKEGITNNDSILEDAFEAIVGAIYLDGGLDKARRFVEGMLKDTIIAIVENGIIFDYKTHLQEITQKRFGCLPEYVIVKEEGQEHNKTFYCDCMIKGVKYGFGIGKSKKEAEKNAAKEAVKKLEKNDV